MTTAVKTRVLNSKNKISATANSPKRLTKGLYNAPFFYFKRPGNLIRTSFRWSLLVFGFCFSDIFWLCHIFVGYTKPSEWGDTKHGYRKGVMGAHDNKLCKVCSVKWSGILIDHLGPDTFSKLRIKGHVLHRTCAHLKGPGWSFVWNALLPQELSFWRNLKFFRWWILRRGCQSEWNSFIFFPYVKFVVLTANPFVRRDEGPLEQQKQSIAYLYGYNKL